MRDDSHVERQRTRSYDEKEGKDIFREKDSRSRGAHKSPGGLPFLQIDNENFLIPSNSPSSLSVG